MKSQNKLVKKSEPKKAGFQRYKPGNPGNTGDTMTGVSVTSGPSDTSVGTGNPLTKQWRGLIKQRGPYYFFITLTFSMSTGFVNRR